MSIQSDHAMGKRRTSMERIIELNGTFGVPLRRACSLIRRNIQGEDLPSELDWATLGAIRFDDSCDSFNFCE